MTGWLIVHYADGMTERVWTADVEHFTRLAQRADKFVRITREGK